MSTSLGRLGGRCTLPRELFAEGGGEEGGRGERVVEWIVLMLGTHDDLNLQRH